jgi:DNA repair protein RecN (Recombination protein N)
VIAKRGLLEVFITFVSSVLEKRVCDVMQGEVNLTGCQLINGAPIANHHLNVQKTASATFTASDVQVLTGDARTAELARMLSGLADSASAREHAQELLALACA